MNTINYIITITYRGFWGRQDIIKVKSDSEIKDTFYNYKNNCFNYFWSNKEREHKTSIPLDTIDNIDIVENKI